MSQPLSNHIRHLALTIALAISAASCSNFADPDTRPAGNSGEPDARRDAPSVKSVHLALGNPSNAVTDERQRDNYLVIHRSYVLSYNNSRGTANWVSWRTIAADLGQRLDRVQFQPDQSLPRGFGRVQSSDYSGSGYDRGHMVPSADRFADPRLNAETFLMTNVVPQTAELNQFPWEKLESYSRTLARKGYDLYTVAGVYGDAGRIRNKVTIPTNCWKVIVILSRGTPLDSVDDDTWVIAVDMPNRNGVAGTKWQLYRTSVREIEQRTGLDLLSRFPREIQDKLETRIGK